MSNQETQIVEANHAMEIAEIESQIATAKRYPMHTTAEQITEFKQKIMTMATIDQDTAEGCYYAIPRGDKPIDGPSVRLAEIALTCYGNCVAESDVVAEDDRFIYAMGQCRDLENNVAVRIKVRRRITYSDGLFCDKCGLSHNWPPKDGQCRYCKSPVSFYQNKRFNDDLIAVTANAACAIAFRNSVFKIIPGAFIKPVFAAVKKKAVGDAKSLIGKRDKVIARLARFGVNTERVLLVLGCSTVDDVTAEHVATLIGLGTAIKDGETTVETAFPIVTFDKAQSNSETNIKDTMGSETVEPSTDDTPDPNELPAALKDLDPNIHADDKNDGSEDWA